MTRPVLAIAGNPNCGKTTLFNALTGANAKVGNYPGITVERREASMQFGDGDGREAQLLDIPGTYSLSARTAEEQVAITAIAGLHPYEEPDAVIVVVDATQLARNLYLVLQVLELRLKVVVALNMSDVLTKHGLKLDAAELSRRLGVPVVPISASRGQGIAALKRALAQVLDAPDDQVSSAVAPLPNGEVAAAIERVAPEVPSGWSRGDEQRRRSLACWALLSLDQGDELWHVPEALRAAVLQSRAASDFDFDQAVVSARYAWIDAAMPALLAEPPGVLRRSTDAVDKLLIHPVAGFTLFVLVMAFVFQALFSWSGPAIDAVGGFFDALGAATADVLPPGLITDFLTDGVIAGVGAVLVFLPQILLLFLFISIMEDSGYMARVAFLMDRIMKAIGLTGRAFVPMLSGFACAIPAIMATRTMERRRDRMLTMMVVPIMTCSARLPVYTLIIAALYPGPDEPGGSFLPGLSLQAAIMVGMYLFSTVLALAAAAVLGRTLLRGRAAPLLLELPPYRMPMPRSVGRMVWERARLFVTEAGTVILVCTIVLWALLTFPQDAELSRDFDAEQTAVQARAEADPSLDQDWLAEQRHQLGLARDSELLRASWGGQLGQAIEPVIAPLGFDWKIGIGLIGAFAAREVFVSTMGVVYGMGDEADEQSLPLREHIQAEVWPDGRRVYTPLVGLSLMVFFALAAQCMSTLAVVKRETQSWRWPLFLFSYMTALAWIASFAVYQGGVALGLG
ncbi:MAG: ferrous iron transport protein B [Planctomycetota bacterium]|nr:MAG: ferrous iron transport protein B [Planctomycetota bacterium]